MSSGRRRLSTTYAWMNCWPHGVIVVPTTPTTASMYAPLNVPCGTTRLCSASPQSGCGEHGRQQVRAGDEHADGTKPYCTRLNEPAPMSTITATAARSAESAAGMPNRDRAAAMPANSETVEPRLAMIIVIAANAAQRNPKRSRMSPVRPWPVARPRRAPISWVTSNASCVTSRTHRS